MDTGFTGGFIALLRLRRRRQFAGRGQDHRIREFLAQPVHLGQRRFQNREDVFGPGEEVVDGPVLDRHRRIFKAGKVFQCRLEVAADQAADVAVPVHRRDHQPVAQVEVGLPVDRVVLVAPGHVPDRGAGQRDRRIAVLAGPQAVFGVVPFDEQRQRLSQLLGDLPRDHARPPAVEVDVDAPVQQRAAFVLVVQRIFGEVVVVLGVRCGGPHEVRLVDHLAHDVQVRRLLQVEHLTADQHRRLGESVHRQHPQNRVRLDADVVVHEQNLLAVSVFQRLVHHPAVATGTAEVGLVVDGEPITQTARPRPESPGDRAPCARPDPGRSPHRLPRPPMDLR